MRSCRHCFCQLHLVFPVKKKQSNTEPSTLSKPTTSVTMKEKLLQLDCAHRAQTSAKAYNLNWKWSGFESGLIRIGMSAGALPTCCGVNPCWRQSFCQVSWKSACDCMRHANKSPKIPYSAMVREVEKWSKIHQISHQKLISSSMSRRQSTRNISSKSMNAFLSNLAHRQTDR